MGVLHRPKVCCYFTRLDLKFSKNQVNSEKYLEKFAIQGKKVRFMCATPYQTC